jgi:hypothetical protein
MKNLILIVILFSVSLFANAETTTYDFSTPNTELSGDSGGLHIIHFKGVLDIWETPSGGLIVSCMPPFLETCFTLIWSLQTDEMTVILNDVNQTEIEVTSEPVTTTGTVGEQIHTFTR